MAELNDWAKMNLPRIGADGRPIIAGNFNSCTCRVALRQGEPMEYDPTHCPVHAPPARAVVPEPSA